MLSLIHPKHLIDCGLDSHVADAIVPHINYCLSQFSAEEAWQKISKDILTPQLPFKLHLFIFSHLFPHWPKELESAPAWVPHQDFIKTTNISHFMEALKLTSVHELHAFSTNHFEAFWVKVIDALSIVFRRQPKKICDFSNGIENPRWLPRAKMNIIDSCFTAPPESIAIYFQNENGIQQTLSYAELNQLSNRIANSLVSQGFAPKDAIAIDMPMTQFAVAIYLGIIKMGGIVVAIADSFSRDEIAIRLRIANPKAIFTQDFILRDAKTIPLYEKVIAANAPRAIVLPCQDKITISLRSEDLAWENFLVEKSRFKPYASDPMAFCNILFSSGTTAHPKAIPWDHTTPIKVASDAYFHLNIQPGDVLTWSTNLGWMMGPWLIFASLINHATIALYDGVPRHRAYGKFIEEAGVTMLGVVPTLVANWRQTQCMEGLSWDKIKLFSSTGECSNPEDMLYLMSLAAYKPIVEYCGGTEIGGSYITSTLIEKNYPSLFSTPALGIDFILLDEKGRPADEGEAALIPPSIGLSTTLLNADHHTVYFEEMPHGPSGKILRRHGDQMRRFPNGYYCALGRADDTMNLGGIKISSAEIERVLTGIHFISEVAAIAMIPEHVGPSRLVIYAVVQQPLDKDSIKKIMQEKLNQQLNPLFKIDDVIFVDALPKTASNKILRRVLRKVVNVE